MIVGDEGGVHRFPPSGRLSGGRRPGGDDGLGRPDTLRCLAHLVLSVCYSMARKGTTMQHHSPLRYPGGKASLANFLAQTIEANALAGCSYFEPFAGGAGAALRLLQKRTVAEVHLNDLDPCITAFWKAVLDEPERFAHTISSVPLNIEEWKNQQNIYKQNTKSDPFDLGFATFYLNRCNRSGVLKGAGPIGGYAQRGKWKMDVRFNRENLIKRILKVAELRDRIFIYNFDALRFLEGLSIRQTERECFVYLDPPYYSKGNRLYMNFYTEEDHRKLASYLKQKKNLKWITSYDNKEFISNLYSDCNTHYLEFRYSLYNKQNAREIVITPSQVILPDYHLLTPTNDKTESNNKLRKVI